MALPGTTSPAGLRDGDDGIEEAWETGHVSGPWDPDELALLLVADEDRA